MPSDFPNVQNDNTTAANTTRTSHEDDAHVQKIEVVIEVATNLKALGNTRFKAGDVQGALEKWESESNALLSPIQFNLILLYLYLFVC